MKIFFKTVHSSHEQKISIRTFACEQKFLLEADLLPTHPKNFDAMRASLPPYPKMAHRTAHNAKKRPQPYSL